MILRGFKMRKPEEKLKRQRVGQPSQFKAPADPEWDKAEAADEMPAYFIFKNGYGGTFVKKYKPSIAKLYASRIGWVDCKIALDPIETERN